MSEEVLEHSNQASSQIGAAKLVPVGESIKYRRRAQQAESQLQEFEQQLKEFQSQLELRNEELAAAEAQRDEANFQLTAAESRMAAERMLNEAGVVDIETASLLLSKRVDMSKELDHESLAHNVEQLLLDKPFLRGVPNAAKRFGMSLPTKTASAKLPRTGPAAQLAQAAEQAAQTGNRRDVAHYLRLRRQASLANRGPAGNQQHLQPQI